MNETLSVISAHPMPFIIAGVIFILGVAAFFLIRWLRKGNQKPLGEKEKADVNLSAGKKRDEISKGRKGEKKISYIKNGVVCEFLDIGQQYKYRAVIRWFPKPGRTPIIEFGNKISEPLGDVIFCEPSCPVSGDAYYIRENKDGSFSPYDPRAAAILSEKTPYIAYDATHWPEAEGVWVFVKNWMEKISSILMWACLIAVILIVLVKVGG